MWGAVNYVCVRHMCAQETKQETKCVKEHPVEEKSGDK
jgi:hypothetical protein